jgi:hypothetical protein
MLALSLGEHTTSLGEHTTVRRRSVGPGLPRKGQDKTQLRPAHRQLRLPAGPGS